MLFPEQLKIEVTNKYHQKRSLIMYRTISRKTRGIVGTMLAVGLMYALGWSTPLLSLVPQSSTVNVGEAVSVDVVLSDLDDQYVTLFDLNVQFDPTVLDFQSFLFTKNLGNYLNDPDVFAFAPSVTVLSGAETAVNIGELSLLSSFPMQDQALATHDPLLLGTITFKGVALGTSNLQFTDNGLLGDFLGYPLAYDVSSPVSMTAVPEPGMMMLSMCGFLGLVLMVVKRKKSS
jgi:hypothetical protein